MEDMKLQDLSVVMEFNGDRLSNLRRREVLRVLILGAKANEAGP